MLSERPFKSADQKTERGKISNPQYSIDRDQPTSRASPLRVNTLLSGRVNSNSVFPISGLAALVCDRNYLDTTRALSKDKIEGVVPKDEFLGLINVRRPSFRVSPD